MSLWSGVGQGANSDIVLNENTKIIWHKDLKNIGTQNIILESCDLLAFTYAHLQIHM